ncbi:MAG: membrane lipoprotein lipid attachment site-containing protein [Acutalibacteraceae bacterium]|nr:membrane lipoprotein lipid attachment site-containing protein [Acutalibacteraceae bacterium]
MKKIFCILTALLIMFILAGCSENPFNFLFEAYQGADNNNTIAKEVPDDNKDTVSIQPSTDYLTAILEHVDLQDGTTVYEVTGNEELETEEVNSNISVQIPDDKLYFAFENVCLEVSDLDVEETPGDSQSVTVRADICYVQGDGTQDSKLIWGIVKPDGSVTADVRTYHSDDYMSTYTDSFTFDNLEQKGLYKLVLISFDDPSEFLGSGAAY